MTPEELQPKVVTSNYANLTKLLEDGYTPLAISIGKPKFFGGGEVRRLMPSWALLKLAKSGDKEGYDRQYDAKLSRLDAQETLDTILERGNGKAALLCWEPPNKRCHRRRVAEWLRDELGVDVPEYGLAPDKTLPYRLMPSKGETLDPNEGQEQLF